MQGVPKLRRSAGQAGLRVVASEALAPEGPSAERTPGRGPKPG